MKKFLSLILAMIVALSLGAIAEPATELSTGFGTIEDVGGWIATYCNEWNDMFGSVLGTDISFNPSNMSIDSRDDDWIVADIDGITFYMDGDMNVLSMETVISGSKVDPYWILARNLAIICVVYYDPPTDKEQTKDMFIELMGIYMDGLEYFTKSLKYVQDGECYSTPQVFFSENMPTQNHGIPTAYFCQMPGGTWFFSLIDHAK